MAGIQYPSNSPVYQTIHPSIQPHILPSTSHSSINHSSIHQTFNTHFLNTSHVSTPCWASGISRWVRPSCLQECYFLAQDKWKRCCRNYLGIIPPFEHVLLECLQGARHRWADRKPVLMGLLEFNGRGEDRALGNLTEAGWTQGGFLEEGTSKLKSVRQAGIWQTKQGQVNF